MRLRNIFQFILLTGLSFNLSAQSVGEVVELYNEGVEYYQTEDFKNALDAFESCIEMADEVGEEADEHKTNAQNNLPGLQLKLATSYLQARDYEKGISALEKTIRYAKEVGDEGTVAKAKKQLPKVYFSNGRAQSKAGNYEGAETNFAKALELKPDFALVYVGKAIMYRKMGKSNDELAAVLKQGQEVAKQSNNVKAKKEILKVAKTFLKYGNEYFKAGKYAESVSALSTYLEFDPNSSVAYYLIAKAYNKQSKWSKAIEAGNMAISKSKGGLEDNAKIYYEIAEAQKQDGQTSKACESFKNASHGPYTEQAKYQIEHVLKCGQ